MIRRARAGLGTLVSIGVSGLPEAEALGRIEAGFTAIAQIHTLMSFHDPDSDVSRLNRRAAFEAVQIDQRTFAVLAQAVDLADRSCGAFDLTIAPQLVEAGFLPLPSDAPAPDPNARWSDIALIPPDRVRFARPLWIDLGGIAKGFAVDAAMAAMALSADCQSVVNAGGDLRVSGPLPERVLLRTRPTEAGDVPVVEIANGSLASSSGQDSVAHLPGRSGGPHRNPLTGRAVGLRSFVSVAAPSCMIADGLTKIVLVRRPQSAPILRHYGATAYLQNGRGEWRILGTRA